MNCDCDGQIGVWGKFRSLYIVFLKLSSFLKGYICVSRVSLLDQIKLSKYGAKCVVH